MKILCVCATLVALNLACVGSNVWLLAGDYGHDALYLTAAIVWSLVTVVNSFSLIEAWRDYRSPMRYAALAWKEFGE